MTSLLQQFHFKQKLETKPGIDYYFAQYKREPMFLSSKAQLDCTVPKLFLKLLT